MNAPTPGWHPDPTGRHQYRYWNGSSWTDDVSDNGVTSADPVGAPGQPTQATDQAQPVDPTHQYLPQGTPGAPGGPGGHPPGPDQPFGSGPVPPAQPAKSGPSTGLIVGLAAVAVALIAGLVFVLSRDDGDDTASNAEPASEDAGVDDTPADGAAADDVLGDLGTGDLDSSEGIVELIAAGMEMEADGAITHDQAMCAAQAIVDHFGVENLIDMSTSGADPFDGATFEESGEIFNKIIECIPVEVLAEMGMSGGG